jgi:histidine phosphotransferase ChpT
MLTEFRSDTFGLAQAVCTRVCHDIGGPTGALAGALEMMAGEVEDAAEVARDAVQVIDRRLRFWRAAVGGVGQPLDAAALAGLAEGLTLGKRLSVSLGGMAPGASAEPALAQALLLAILLATESLPRGGTVRVSGSPETALAVQPEGPAAAWPAALSEVLRNRVAVPLTPRGVALPLLGMALAAGRVRLDLAEPTPGAPPPPLVLRAGDAA